MSRGDPILCQWPAAALLVLLAAPARSQTDASDAGVPSVSDAEAAEIERALAGDAEVKAAAEEPRSLPQRLGSALQSMNPELSLTLDTALAAFSARENLQTGGHDPTATGFNLQQLELAASASVDPYFRFDANIVFLQTGVEIEEAYGITLALPHGLQARLGQFLTRFGRLNPTHLHAWSFVDQPLALGRVFGSEGNRGLGGELSWLTPLPWFVELTGSVTDAQGEATARSFFGAENPGISSPLDFQFTGAVKQFFELSEAWSILWGLSAANGPNPSGRRNRTDVYGTDLYVKYRPLTEGSVTVVSLQTEWLYRRRQLPGDLLQDVTGYAFLFWRFAARWATALRYEYGSPAAPLSGTPQVGVDPLDPDWTQARHRVSANLTFWPTEFSRFRLQGSADYPLWRSPIYAAFLAVEFTVGAHAAHQF